MPDLPASRLPDRLPAWWFPDSLVGHFPEGRPLAGAGFALGLTLYLLAHILVSLSALGQASFQVFVLGLSGPRLVYAPLGLVLAVFLTTTRGQTPTPRQQSLDDWTLVTIVVLAAIVAVLAALGFVVQLTDWTGGFLPTLYDLLIHIGAVVSTMTTALWALGRLYAVRSESRVPGAPVAG